MTIPRLRSERSSVGWIEFAGPISNHHSCRNQAIRSIYLKAAYVDELRTEPASDGLKVRNRQIDFGDVTVDYADWHIDMNRLYWTIDNVARDDRSFTELNQRIYIGRFIFESWSHGDSRDVERNNFPLPGRLGPRQAAEEWLVSMVAAIGSRPIPGAAFVALHQ